MKSLYRILKIIPVLVLVVMVGCRKKDNSIPDLITADPTNVTDNSLNTGGSIFSSGSSEIKVRGVCWSINEEPTINNSRTIDGSGSGEFVSKIIGLIPDRTYFIRAYATNDFGTAYGNELSITTSPPDTVATDSDGNIYHFITIGKQVWLKENLRTTKYADGSPVGTTSPATIDISSEATPKYEWPSNGDESLASVYGRLYTGFAIEASQLCPTGWHIPTDDEWGILIDNLGGMNVTGGKLKEAGLEHWSEPNTHASDSTGFDARPAGLRNADGTFSMPGQNVYYWSSTPSNANLWGYSLHFDDGSISRDRSSEKAALSVRCIKDVITSYRL
jgi:uncharacterized protein (TIGR02145 family)